MARARSEVAIRLAGEEDRDALCALIGAFRDHLGASRPRDDELAAYLPTALADPALEFALALSADRAPAGYAHYRFHRSVWAVGFEAHLEDLFVIAESRGRRIGERLLEVACERAARRGAVAMGLHTNENNHGAQAFYHRVGFAPRSEVAWKGGREQYWVRRLGPT